MAAKKKGEAAPQAVEGGKFKRVKAVTLPVFKKEIDKPMYLRITGAMFEGKEQKQAADGKDGKKAVKMEPATLCHVVNVETGEQGQIIVEAVLKGILEEQYPDAAYVDKAFEITKHAKKEGKRYHTFSVFEIEA